MSEPGELSDYDITAAMIACGGGFVARLGEMYRHADPKNQHTIRVAFADIWEQYRNLAIVKLKGTP